MHKNEYSSFRKCIHFILISYFIFQDFATNTYELMNFRRRNVLSYIPGHFMFKILTSIIIIYFSKKTHLPYAVSFFDANSELSECRCSSCYTYLLILIYNILLCIIYMCDLQWISIMYKCKNVALQIIKKLRTAKLLTESLILVMLLFYLLLAIVVVVVF